MESSNKFTFDNALLSLADTQGGIDGLLDYFFGFLGRRTDFYQKPLLAKELCDKYITKHVNLAQESLQKANQKRDNATSNTATANATNISSDPKFELNPQQETKASSTTTADFETPHNKSKLGVQTHSSAVCSEPSTEGSASKKAVNRGNGYDTEGYSWTQTLGTVDLSIRIPPGTKRKCCRVVIQQKRLKVVINNEDVIDEALEDTIKTEDSFWTLVDEKVLQVTLEKVKGMKWWSRVFQNHAELDTSKIVPESSKLSDLDGETRQTVEKMLFDQRQKQLGLPTSEQQEQFELIEKFKRAHPDLDFSQAKMSL